MISFKTISSFRSRLSGLLSVRRKVYVNVENEIKQEFAGKPIEQIRQNNDIPRMVHFNSWILLMLS